MGITSALGLTARDTFTRLVRGERGLSTIDLFDTSAQRANLGAQVRGVTTPPGDVWSRTTAFAHLAAKEALEHANLDPKSARVALIAGGTTAGMFENETYVVDIMSGKLPRAPIAALRSHPLSSTTDALDATLGPFVRARNVASACSSGVTALSLAMAWLLDDEIDAVVAGGTDGICRLTLSGFNALSATDPEPCRPFDIRRRGLNLGEGAGFLVLERATDAKRRGRSPLAELAGASLAAEAHHITNPDSEGRTAARVMREALARAGVAPSEVDYINAHGTGTPLNDAMESKAIRSVLGEEAARVWVSSSKAQIGHTLAASGAIEAVIATMCITDGVLPPTAGLAEPDPACALRHVTTSQRMERVRAVVSNSFGFGGMDGAVVITEPELARERTVSKRRVVVSASAVLEQPSGITPDAKLVLDPARARRFDRSARLCAVVAHAVLPQEINRERCGVVFGSAFSSVDEAAAFVLRIHEKGPRLASPAEFPNLVPSSPIGHASIYESLRGPALATADLRASAESAVLTAFELIAAGDADAFVAGGVAVRSQLIDDVFFPLFDDGATHTARSECCGAILVEAEATSANRAVANLEAIVHRDDAPLALPAPREGARIFGYVAVEAITHWVAGTSWSGVAIETVERAVGSNEAAGAAAFDAALRAIAKGETSHALVIGARAGVRYGFVLSGRG